ncbi:AP endonuclease (plasmid) [Streptomyces sp. NBC_01724]|uniref:AP endonuclease n=1 Tax=Streptomyces sp. NBC_01724 TaxID=2975922 RepID=UPI002E2FAB56|nr:AP endonuclease [Streptomyces sp. NBC_01724]
MSAAGIGLYSIGVRGLDVPELLEWAGAQGVPFVHLRGGPRGFDLARQPQEVLARWRRCGESFVPVTGVTADLDLADLFALSVPERARARAELELLAVAAAAIGAGWVRLLSRAVPQGPLLAAMLTGKLPVSRLPLLVELHHPSWLAPAALGALERLLELWPRTRILADTSQLAAALPSADGKGDVALERVLDLSRVLHLSDDGSGLDAAGRAVVAERARDRIGSGQGIEVAVEWTGQPRTPQACLDRHREACRWWAQSSGAPPRRQ